MSERFVGPSVEEPELDERPEDEPSGVYCVCGVDMAQCDVEENKKHILHIEIHELKILLVRVDHLIERLKILVSKGGEQKNE